MKIPDSVVFEISVMVHNLKINPNEVPDNTDIVLNENGDKVRFYNGHWFEYSDYYESDVEAELPKLWYDIPEFDIERTELEKLSKEELIDMILNKEK